MSDVCHDGRDGSGVCVGTWSQTVKPIEMRVGEGISNAVVCALNVLENDSEIVGRCCEKECSDQGHEPFLL